HGRDPMTRSRSFALLAVGSAALIGLLGGCSSPTHTVWVEGEVASDQTSITVPGESTAGVHHGTRLSGHASVLRRTRTLAPHADAKVAVTLEYASGQTVSVPVEIEPTGAFHVNVSGEDESPLIAVRVRAEVPGHPPLEERVPSARLG